VRGIEAAFWGTLGKDPELKTSKTGTRFATMNAVVTVDQANDGKDVTQWVRVACFGDTAEKIAARTKKGDRIYVEGQLTMTQWNAADGEVRHGLNVAAWKCERVGNIGRNREKKEHSEAPSAAMPNGAGSKLSESYCAGPAEPRPRSSADGYDWDRGDRLPF
jgi:single stranded DNA-binding protein